MPGETIDGFNTARAPYQPSDSFGLGIGATTYQGNLAELSNYMQKRAGTGQITPIGNVNYVMTSTDSELVTTVPLTSSPTWQLPQANSVLAGTRRRFVDMAGVCALGSFGIAIAPNGTDKINGVTGSIFLADKNSHIILESDGATNWVVVDYGGAMMRQDNLAGLSSPATARANLGLGTIATRNSSEFLLGTNNLSDITSQAAARANLGITPSTNITYGNIDPSAIATPAQVVSDTPSKLMGTDAFWTSQVPVQIPWQQTGCPWDFDTFINGLFDIPTTSTATPHVTLVPSHFKLGQRGFIIIRNRVVGTGRYIDWPGVFNLVPSTATNTLFPAATSTAPSVNLFEYWCESASMVRIRVSTAI